MVTPGDNRVQSAGKCARIRSRVESGLYQHSPMEPSGLSEERLSKMVAVIGMLRKEGSLDL